MEGAAARQGRTQLQRERGKKKKKTVESVKKGET